MRITHAVCSLSVALLATPAVGQEFFPHNDLDYWGEGPREKAPKTQKAEKQEKPSAAPRSGGEPPFRWEDYEDPTTDAFWDDGGNYRPPRPLRVVAANPTPENVARYLRWQRKKVETIAALQAEVTRQVGEVVVEEPTVVADRQQQAEILASIPDPVDWRRVEIVFFYSSDCPHCRASVDVTRQLVAYGAKVIPVQMDWQKNPPLLTGSVPYTAEIAQEQQIEAVPTWVIAYAGDRITMEGEVTVQSIEVTLKLAQQRQQQQMQTEEEQDQASSTQ